MINWRNLYIAKLLLLFSAKNAKYFLSIDNHFIALRIVPSSSLDIFSLIVVGVSLLIGLSTGINILPEDEKKN